MTFVSEFQGIEFAVIIGIWAWLFTGPLSEPEQIFAPIKNLIYRALTAGGHKLEGWRKSVYLPLIGCQNCHAGQFAFWWQVWNAGHGKGFDISFIILAISTAFFVNATANFLHKK